jgi:hypothetical protein
MHINFPSAVFSLNRVLRKTLCLALLSPVVLVAQTTHIWTGNLSDSWGQAGNWEDENVPGNGDSLIFDGSITYTWNDLGSVLLRHITFAETAEGGFELDGDGFRVGGTITNNSDYEVNIYGDIQVVTGGGVIPNSRAGSSQGLVIDTGRSGITLYGSITHDNVDRALVKTGSAALTITGNVSTLDHTIVNMADLVFSGATRTASGNLVLGSGYTADATNEYDSARVVLTNNADIGFGAITLRYYSAKNVIAVENGSTFTYNASLDNASNRGTWYPSPVGAAGGFHSGLSNLLIDLTDGGRFVFAHASAVAGTVVNIGWMTITEMVDDVQKTGFIYIDSETDGEETIKFATRARVGKGLVEMPTGSSLDASVHYVVVSDGNEIKGGDNTTLAAGYIRGASLTITGEGGTLSTTNAGNNRLTINKILMEEGTGDFSLNLFWQLDGGVSATGFIHQHSTEGTLYLLRDIKPISVGARVVKTGAGTVVSVNTAPASTHTGETEVQDGRFVLNSVFGQTGYFRVRGAGSILSGEGSIGGQGATPVYSRVQVIEGATLEGDRHLSKALDITGSLEFSSSGNYRMNLHADPQYDPLTVKGTTTAAEVNLAGNLELILQYAVNWLSSGPIVLLRTDGSIDGEFDTINGIAGNLFSLTYNDMDYWFEIDYQYDMGDGYIAVALHAIPEPSAFALLVGLSLVGCVIWVRRRK